MQRYYNGATIHVCAKKGSAACGKKSTKILKIHILALRVPGASLQAQRAWGHCTRGDSAQVGTKKGSATMEIFIKREELQQNVAHPLLLQNLPTL